MFSGFKYGMSVSAASGRVVAERDYDQYCVGLIKQVLLTRPGERINRPFFGSNIRSMLFAPLSEATANLAQTSVYSALKEELSDFIVVEDVRVEAQQPSTFIVSVVYLLRSTNEKRFLNVEVTE